MKVVLLVSVIVGIASGAMADRVIKIGYIEFPPVFSTNADGKPEGFLIDLADTVLKRVGYEWEATSFPTKRMASELVNGNIDLWIGLSTLPEFTGTTLVGESKVAAISLRAFTIGQKTPIEQKEDLKGKSILVIRGYSYGGWIHYIKDPANQIKFEEIDSHQQGFLMLKAKRADYFLDYRMPAEKALKDLSIQDLSSNEISAFGAYFVVSKKSPDAEGLLQKMEKAYKDLVQEGILTSQ